jgi:hypothetical protein
LEKRYRLPNTSDSNDVAPNVKCRFDGRQRIGLPPGMAFRDSGQLAEAMTYALADLHENSSNANSGNGVAMFDYNGYNPSFG